MGLVFADNANALNVKIRMKGITVVIVNAITFPVKGMEVCYVLVMALAIAECAHATLVGLEQLVIVNIVWRVALNPAQMKYVQVRVYANAEVVDVTTKSFIIPANIVNNVQHVPDNAVTNSKIVWNAKHSKLENIMIPNVQHIVQAILRLCKIKL